MVILPRFARFGARAVQTATALLLPLVLLSGTGYAADSQEFWPELNLFKTLNPTTRLHFAAAYAKGKESDFRSLDLAGYLDVSLEPLLRKSLRSEDWRKNKYLWARVGYTHVSKAEEGVRKAGEDRGVVSLYSRAYMPAEVLVEARVRADLRWIGGDYSTRYRVRAEVNREFTVGGRGTTPYLQVESFYDTRYDSWSRNLYQLGVEVVTTPHVRLESYVAHQVDDRPELSTVNAFGVVAKWFY